jgi:hypothetical protein
MYTTIIEFLSKHLVVAALLTSALWFFGGYQYLRRGRQTVGLAWQVIGVLVLAAFCVNVLLSKDWYDLIVALGGIMVELWLIQRCGREKHVSHS